MSFTFGGVDLSGASYGVVCVGMADELIAESRVDVQDLGGEDGAVSQGTRLGPRKFSMECAVLGTSELDLRGKVDLVRSVLDSRVGEQLLVMNRELLLPAALRRGRYCRVTGAIGGKRRGLGWFFTADFVQPSPFDVGDENTESGLTVDSNPKTLYVPSGTGAIGGASNESPIVITSAGHGLEDGQRVTISGMGGNTAANGTWWITYIDAGSFSLNGSVGNGAWTTGGTWVELVIGTAWALPVWMIRNTGGTLSNPVILTNETTEETIRVTALSPGWYVKIDSERKHVERSADGTTWVNGMTSKTAGDPFPRLAGWARNEITVEGLSSGTLGVVWRSRWI